MYMQDVDQQYHQPFFLWEGICNLFGFIIIFFLLDLIKNRKIRKCGDLAIIYFLWYGIVRICLQPFRAGDGGHAANMITTELWIAAAVVLLVLNHLVFPRLRKYKMLDWPKVFVNKFFGVKKYKYTEKKGSEIFYYRGL
jgi:phosphatidylglycerol:prolipoprotein diacylglycerol transferase